MRNFFLLLPLLIGLTGRAETVVWNANQNSLRIGQQMDLLRDEQGTLTIQDVSSPALTGKFTRSTEDVLSFDFSGTPYWLRFSLKNETADSLLLVLAQAIIPTADLYFKMPDGKWQSYKAGSDVHLDKKPVRDCYQVFPLLRGDHEYFIRMISHSPPVLARVENVKTYEVKSTKLKITYGIYAGILFGVIMYNLFWFISLGKFDFLHYASVVFVYLLISGLVMDGYIIYLFPNIDLIKTYASLSPVAYVNATLYAIWFLQIKKYVPRLYNLSVGVMLYLIVWGACHLLMPYKVVLIMNQANALITLGFIFTLALSAGYNRNRVGYYFALAYLIYLFLVIVEVVFIQTGRPKYIYGISHVNIAILIESIVLTFLLSKRFSWEQEDIQRAKDEAQRDLFEKTKENEQMVLEQNIVLENTVKERSKELVHKNEILEKALAEKEQLVEEKEMLRYESHHRIKNNLNNIVSILTLQSQSLNDKQAKSAIADSLSRVKSVSLVHENLYETGELENVQFDSFIQSLIAQIQSMYHEKANRISLSWDCPAMRIPLNKANVLGLIINELLTNSFKYAFNKEGEGKIKIQLRHISTGENNSPEDHKIRLTYWDNGPGLKSERYFKETTTFGLRIIKGMSKQIGAEVAYSKTNGSEFDFIFTAEAIGMEV